MNWILICLLILFGGALWNAIKNQNTGSYNFLCLTLIILTIFLLIGPLEYTIKGQQLEIEQKVDEIETKQKELQKIVETLTKMIFIANESYTTFGGTPVNRRKKLEEHKKSIAEYLPPGFEEELSRELKDLSPKRD